MDRQAEFLELLLQHQSGVKSFIQAMVRDRQACDDLFQDVALEAWRGFDNYDRARPFGAWARGIAANKIMQTFEKQQRRKALFSKEAMQRILNAYDEAEPDMRPEKDALHECMQKLPQKSRELLAMRYERAMKLTEIAEEIGKSMVATNKTLSRLRQSLAKCIHFRLANAERGA